MAAFTSDDLKLMAASDFKDAYNFFEHAAQFKEPEVRVRDLTSESSAGSMFPPQNRTSYTNPAGIITDIVCTSYSDYHFVTITQLKKFGTVIHAWADRHLDGSSGVTYEMNVLLGKREDTLLTVYARQIMQRIGMSSTKPLILAIALRESDDGRDADTFACCLSTFLGFTLRR